MHGLSYQASTRKHARVFRDSPQLLYRKQELLPSDIALHFSYSEPPLNK